MEIGILRLQLIVFDDPTLHIPATADDAFAIVDEEEEEEHGANPVAILRIFHGRGRNTKYLVEWSDGRLTINSAPQISDFAPELLRSWRRANATRNNRLSRERKRSQ